MVDAEHYLRLANAACHILGQYAIFLRGSCGYGSDGRIEGWPTEMPNKKLVFFDYCCIASAADLWCSRLASYTEFGMGKRSCWHCAYRYYFRYQAAPMEKNRSSRIRFCKTVFFSFEQKALRTAKALC